MRPANKTPRPREIQRTRAFVRGLGPTQSHVPTNARPTTPRKDSIVSTLQPEARMILPSTSDTPSETPAAKPGAEGKMERKAKRAGLVREAGLTHTPRRRASQRLGGLAMRASDRKPAMRPAAADASQSAV